MRKDEGKEKEEVEPSRGSQVRKSHDWVEASPSGEAGRVAVCEDVVWNRSVQRCGKDGRRKEEVGRWKVLKS